MAIRVDVVLVIVVIDVVIDIVIDWIEVEVALNFF